MLLQQNNSFSVDATDRLATCSPNITSYFHNDEPTLQTSLLQHIPLGNFCQCIMSDVCFRTCNGWVMNWKKKNFSFQEIAGGFIASDTQHPKSRKIYHKRDEEETNRTMPFAKLRRPGHSLPCGNGYRWLCYYIGLQLCHVNVTREYRVRQNLLETYRSEVQMSYGQYLRVQSSAVYCRTTLEIYFLFLLKYLRSATIHVTFTVR